MPAAVSAPGKICFVTADFEGIVRNGGIGTHFALMSRLLARRGWEVQVLFCGTGDDDEQLRSAPETWAAHGVGFHVLSDFPEAPGGATTRYGGDYDTLVYSEHVLTALRELHARHDFDLIEFPDWGALGLRPIQAKLSGAGFDDVSFAVKLHSTTQWQREGNLKFRPTTRELKLEFCEQYAFENADVQLSPSEYMLDYARGVDWKVREDAAVAYPYPDPEGVAASAPAIEELVFFGRLERRKGLHLFLDALDEVDPRMPVLFLGKDTMIDGEQATDLIAERLGERPHRIETELDRRSALRELRAGGRLAVIPSLSETFGFTVAECVVDQIPFVAARAGGIPEVVDHELGRGRWLFEPSSASLSEAISRRLKAAEAEEADLRREVAAACAPETWNDRVEAVYRGFVRRSAPSVERVAEPSRVGVAVPHYNHEEFLPGALASLAAQTRAPDEVIVVDDGSTSDGALRAFTELEARYPQWTFLRQQNAGPGVTRNRCLEGIEADFFLPFDSDNVATPMLVERLVEAMDRNPSRAVTSCHYLAFAKDEDIAADEFLFRYSPTGGPRVASCLENVYGDSCSLFRADTLRSVGGFEIHDWSPHEDWETFVKLAVNGHEVAVLPEPLFYYRTEIGGRLQKLTADPALIVRQRSHMIERFFLGADLTAREWTDLWECLVAFDHLSFKGLNEHLNAQALWHQSEMAGLRAWSDAQVEELRAHMVEQVEAQRLRAETLERERAELRAWSDVRVEELRAHLQAEVEGQRSRVEALERGEAPVATPGPPSAPRPAGLRARARGGARRVLSRAREAARSEPAPPGAQTVSLPRLRRLVKRVLAHEGWRLQRFPRTLLRRPEAELKMSLDFALARRVELADDFYFVQVGAFDGRTDDPIYGWVQAYGWDGLLIEPQPRAFEQLRENYADREGLEFRQVAIASERETRQLYVVAPGPGIPGWAGMLASFDRDVLLSHRPFLPEIDRLVESEPVECLPINELLAETGRERIDLLQIDVEGYDHELVLAVELGRFKPSIIRFEHAHLSAAQREACLERLIAYGYRIATEATDTLAYLPEEIAEHGRGGVTGGPAQLQAKFEREAEEAHQAHLAHVAELERRLADAEAHTQRVQREAEAHRQRSLDEQEAFLSARLAEALARAESAERELRELRSSSAP